MSRKPTTVVKTIERVDRHGTSRNGNPQYRVRFTDGTSALTQSDSAIAYEIQNGEFRNTPVEFTLTRAGRVSYARPLPAVEPVSDSEALGYLQTAVDLFLSGQSSEAQLRRDAAWTRAGNELHWSRP